MRISGPVEDIWRAVLGREVRISGPGEDIWVAVLEREGDGERRGRDQGAAPAYMLAPWLLEFGRSREHRLEAQKYYEKCIEIPLEVILYGLKWKSAFLEKWPGFDVKMHQNRQKTVKTSELEDQDAVILGLAVWPEEPREIDFFKKSWFS